MTDLKRSSINPDSLGEHFDDVTKKLSNVSTGTPKNQVQDLARIYLAISGEKNTRVHSNALWSGAGVERNRIASVALADATVRYKPIMWAMLRTAIGCVNGMGVEKDPVRALALLSDPGLLNVSAAAYFRSQAHEQIGNNEQMDDELRKAAELGHAVAIKKISTRELQNG